MKSILKKTHMVDGNRPGRWHRAQKKLLDTATESRGQTDRQGE